MNLYDIVVRADRMLGSSPSHTVEAMEMKLPGGGHRAVRLAAGGDGLLLEDAHQAITLLTFPTCPGWVVHLEPHGGFQVWLETDGMRHCMFESVEASAQVKLSWPIPVPMQFNLRLVAMEKPATVSVGPLFNPRDRLLPLLVGKGVEVGPGRNPAVLPSESRDVSYVEQMSRDQWAKVYAKHELDSSAAGHWDRYIVDSAHHLDQFADGSLDFIFSSHVIEHLVNPLGVLRNWWRKLAPGGAIVGVVPDARFTFDLRQPPSSEADFLAQLDRDSYEPSEAMYETWCRHTAPYNTPHSLRERGYSIHVNYYSVDSFRHLLQLFGENHPLDGVFMESATNGKDFGFLIAKPS